MMCGGCTQTRAPSAEEKTELETVLREQLESHIGHKPQIIEVVEICTQVVAGINYFAKVKIGNDNYIHARIFQDLPCNGGKKKVHSVLKDKSATDSLKYF
ncbi:Cystatin A (Stefin A) (Predicted) [Fasciola gigantica]|uniref:Cystatin A (Stefin A) (Predicted) n=1 Tax=Fasciola gigantica TaxID=46835 RepID=C6GC97_FASGI|nr:Stefin-1 [Fasciola gigantica]TPP61430.1 Cystatin A (Stefin A) (Predicted) [Fasciola gigantica]